MDNKEIIEAIDLCAELELENQKQLMPEWKLHMNSPSIRRKSDSDLLDLENTVFKYIILGSGGKKVSI